MKQRRHDQLDLEELFDRERDHDEAAREPARWPGKRSRTAKLVGPDSRQATRQIRAQVGARRAGGLELAPAAEHDGWPELALATTGPATPAGSRLDLHVEAALERGAVDDIGHGVDALSRCAGSGRFVATRNPLATQADYRDQCVALAATLPVLALANAGRWHPRAAALDVGRELAGAAISRLRALGLAPDPEPARAAVARYEASPATLTTEAGARAVELEAALSVYVGASDRAAAHAVVRALRRSAAELDRGAHQLVEALRAALDEIVGTQLARAAASPAGRARAADGHPRVARVADPRARATVEIEPKSAARPADVRPPELVAAEIDRVSAELAADPRGRLADDPDAWRADQVAAALAAGGRFVDPPAASEVPYRGELEEAFGESFAGVRAYLGHHALRGRHGAHAAAWSDAVAFADAPSKPLVAHELAHIVQMRRHGARAGTSTPSDAAEREADAVAEAIARGARRVVIGTGRPAALSFSPGPGPTTPAAATVAGVVDDATERAQREGMRWAVALGRAQGLDAAIAAIAGPAAGASLRAAVIAGAERIANRGVELELAGQAQPAQVTLDDVLRLLAQVFLGPELEAYGLPRSFGNDRALEIVRRELAESFDDALRAAALAGNDPGAAARAFTVALATHDDAIDGAIASVVSSWDDPLDLVELELRGAIEHLGALRRELAGAPRPRQHELGGKIAHLARYVLLLGRALGDPAQRAAQQRAFRGAASLRQLAAAGAVITQARRPIDSERDTLRVLGNRAELLGAQQVTAVDDGGDATTTTVAPEEAFAHHVDDLMASAQEEIASHVRHQERELDAELARLAPKRVATRRTFRDVYARWFGFFSKEERDDQIGPMLQLYELAAPLIASTPYTGLIALFGTQSLIARTWRMPGASDAFIDEIAKVRLERSTAITDTASRGGGAGVDYRFGELRPGERGTGVAQERGSRQAATRDAIANRRASVGAVERAPAHAQDRVIVEHGLAPADPSGRPLHKRLYSPRDFAAGRDGTDRGWNYLLPAEVAQRTGHLETVYEHKAMRDEAARYLLAAAQRLHALGGGHAIEDGPRGHRLGDAAGRRGDVEASTANASAVYGSDRDTGAARSRRARAELAAARQRAGVDPRNPKAGLAAAAHRLIGALEASLDGYFAHATAEQRMLAIILDIGVAEVDLDEAVWSQFSPDALWGFARDALVLGGIVFSLHALGPIGQLIAEIAMAAMFKDDERKLASVAVALVGWLEGATTCTTFSEARTWAFLFRPLAQIVAQTARDWIAHKAAGTAGRQLGAHWQARKAANPRTVGELRAQLAPIIAGDPNVRREIVRQLEANLAGALGTGQPLTADQYTVWAMLHAVDPAAARRVARRHPQLPELHDKSPLGGDPTRSLHTPLTLASRATEIRGEIDRHLSHGQLIQPYRVEVLTPAEFARRFASQHGRASVLVHEHGHAVIYARPDVTPADLADEAVHLIQLNDARRPELAESIRMLGDATLGQWPRMDLEVRKQLFERKLEVELDAKQRRLAELRAGTPEWRSIHDQAAQLERLQVASRAITADQLQLMKAAPEHAPAFLRDPAWLFSKQTTTAGLDLAAPMIDTTRLHRTAVTDSPARAFGTVAQIGAPWTQTTIITASNTGTVRLDPAHPDRVLIGGRVYVFEDGATLNPQLRTLGPDERVGPGTLLATEPTERYRLVELTRPDGTTQQRLETYSRKRAGWVLAGEAASKRGQRMERAARAELTAELDHAVHAGAASGAPDRLVDWMRIPHQSSHGHGFDDVVVEFRGEPPTARIRIIEVKDYPNRNLQLGEMSAIRENLVKNMDRLRLGIRNAVRAPTASERPVAYRRLTRAQLDALDDALERNEFQIELRLGATTSVGPESRKGSLLSRLRAELKASTEFGGKDVLATGDPHHIDERHVDEQGKAGS